MDTSQIVQVPMDLIRLSLDERLIVKCKGDRELYGKLHAFDSHLNMILGDVIEVASVVTYEEESGEEKVKETKRTIELVFVRGDSIILVSIPHRM